MAILFADVKFLEHETGSHPESAERLRVVYRHLEQIGLLAQFDRPAIQPASAEQLARVHSTEYIDSIDHFARQGGGLFDADTVVCPRSFDVAQHAAGVAIAAVDHVISGSHNRAVCLCRPPGHHASSSRAMGFCLFNNVAVAARHAIVKHELSRVLIVDWDVHHGNGTQDIFYNDSTVTFFSAHRYPFYPGSGTEDETGSGAGLGTSFNLPLPFGISRSEYRSRFESMLHAAAQRAKPELILVSAGFDAHATDPIGSLGLESDDFSELTQLIVDAADTYCHGKIVSLLEGGYNPLALAESVECHLSALLQ